MSFSPPVKLSWRSLQTRVTLLMLGVFVLGMVGAIWGAGRLLQQDLQAQLAQQQFATVSIVASEVNQELADRLRALELVAKDISPALLANPRALQQHLQARPVLQAMFNAGTFITNDQGVGLAALPLSIPRIGVTFWEPTHVNPVLAQGKSVISPVMVGKQLHSPSVSLVAPVLNPQGQPMGALVGVIDLAKPNFLDKIAGSHYGRTGSYVLVARAQRLMVTSSDKRNVMQALPAPGVNAMADRFVAGYEGSGVGTTPAGAPVLVAAKNVPVANWYLAAHLPTAEAFAPISALQQRMGWGIAWLTLLLLGLTWWVLRRQLAPLVSTAAALSVLPAPASFPAALPVLADDEVGQLITGFNHLLHSLRERDAVLQRKQQQLDLLVHEQSAMLNEIHHRVKNNLQIITSLLRLEAGRNSQPGTRAVLQDMQGRIRSMALLHEALYRTGTFASVNLADYVRQLATQAFRAQSHAAVQLQLDLTPVQVSMDMATPCGLLVNELITNSLKHAFPDGRSGTLSVCLQPDPAQADTPPSWSLCVCDNGVGLPPDYEQRRSQSLGLQLATDLAQQMGGVLHISPSNCTAEAGAACGASFTVHLTPDLTASAQP
ncbi:histidine kinase dimerization/phosphoacceptor domain -containing protein [Rhodoferax sp.]|uniref:sensor histidine kinase n=1 Tax=Rhodoferax sp. TaxID=50421 RepID=UPI002628C796|nr:histidine kinase dimerization/phosphoacceptor domain -containing protein [Rhodoferax sp.]MDD2811217.1 histidine kinase dimerization/phosphoacceptor domain -containing protein [Rhodoferax sp.]